MDRNIVSCFIILSVTSLWVEVLNLRDIYVQLEGFLALCWALLLVGINNLLPLGQ